MKYEQINKQMNESVAKVTDFNKGMFDASLNYFNQVTDIFYGLYNVEKPVQMYKAFTDSAKEIVEKSQINKVFGGIFKA